MKRQLLLETIIVCAVAAACGTKDSATGGASSNNTAATATNAPAAATPTGKVVTVELNSDEKGNYFKPATFEVHRGDVVRFTLKSGVHNVHFLPDSNAGKSNLPPASDMLQLPDQTFDVPVNFAEGTYYFQCDPHAALGMMGHMKVED
ncbi:MAG TPA: plastocyanin/azurin family copper-binding protein [Gemmatimonadaceae bacterium]|nr:plastocyanin/azurin family copper-binding protein [Gemmatimonadaceae bacterium]